MSENTMKVMQGKRLRNMYFLTNFIFILLACIWNVNRQETEPGTNTMSEEPLWTDLRENASWTLKLHGIMDKRPNNGAPMKHRYCNLTSGDCKGDEGNPLNGYKLKLIHIFMRHGHRTNNDNTADYNCKFKTWYRGSEQKIRQFVPSMAQYSGRQPAAFKNWTLYPDSDTCGSGQLTTIGALQLIRYGQYIKHKYVDSSDLFDTTLPLSDQIYVTSTAIPRTFQSAVAFVYGFVENCTVACLNISKASSALFCQYNRDCHCKRTNTFLKKDYLPKASYNENLNKLANVFPVEGKLWLPLPLDHFSPCHKWNPLNCVCCELITDMWDEMIAANIAKLTEPKQYSHRNASLVMNPVYVEIAIRMNNITMRPQQKQRLFLYLGHDTTLSPLVRAVGLNKGTSLPFAVRFVIEFYEKMDGSTSSTTSGKTNFFLKFIYMGLDETENIVFCEGKTIDGLCPFAVFNEFVFQKMFQRFNYTCHEDAC